MQNYAQLDWQNNTPYSKQYEDVYFSSDNGFAETEYVFIKQNGLIDRWATLDTSTFTIIETGFGTGLNFLTAWQTWLNHAPKQAQLNFISIEKYPISPVDLAKALSIWPQLQSFSTQLIKQYQPVDGGWHRYIFNQGRIRLTLIVGDVLTQLPKIQTYADAWFLDGFSPSKNPRMWQSELFQHMARISHYETTFSTFTSASNVRKGLFAAGFQVEKVSGYGKKREMLKGKFAQKKLLLNAKPKHVIVLGGGIAGCATAQALASRGVYVTLIEQHENLAQEASGNPVGVLYPRISHLEHIPSQFSLLSYLYTLNWLKNLELVKNDYAFCGVLQLGFNARELARCEKVASLGLTKNIVEYVSASQASEIAGIKLEHPGLFFPQAGWLKPQHLCRYLATHPYIEIKIASYATKLIRQQKLWQVRDEQHCIAEAPTVVLANAGNVNQFNQTAHIPLLKVRGQISMLKENFLNSSIKSVLCSDGYFTPSIIGEHCLGATFSADDNTLVARDIDHLEHLQMLKNMSEDLHDAFAQQNYNSRVAWRCTTSDYLPIAGQMLNADALRENPPRVNTSEDNLPWIEGLYLNTAHGSKGLTSAPYCAEIIASQICTEPLPIAKDLAKKISPNRFLLRKLGLKNLC